MLPTPILAALLAAAPGAGPLTPAATPVTMDRRAVVCFAPGTPREVIERWHAVRAADPQRWFKEPGAVNAADLASLLAAMTLDTTEDPADLNADGAVDTSDLLMSLDRALARSLNAIHLDHSATGVGNTGYLSALAHSKRGASPAQGGRARRARSTGVARRAFFS